MSYDGDTNKSFFRKTPPQKRTLTHRERYVSWLEQLQKPNQVLIKKGNQEHLAGLPMLPAKAALLLAEYDGILPASPAMKLHVLFQELPRNPRKGKTPPWPISNA